MISIPVSFFPWSPILILQLPCLYALGIHNQDMVMAQLLNWAFLSLEDRSFQMLGKCLLFLQRLVEIEWLEECFVCLLTYFQVFTFILFYSQH